MLSDDLLSQIILLHVIQRNKIIITMQSEIKKSCVFFVQFSFINLKYNIILI